jgi:hypothetical protein
MRIVLVFPCLLLGILLASCREHPPAPAAAVPASAPVAAPVPAAASPSVPTAQQLDAEAAALRERAVLMQAIFGDKFNSSSNEAPMQLGEPDRDGERMYAIEPVAHSLLPNGDAVLVANALEVLPDRDGNRIHTEGGLLNIFIVRKREGRWRLLKHHANIARMGSWERIGKAEFVNLASGKPGLLMRFGSGFQQFSESAIGLFDLGADPIRPLAGEGIAVAASSPGCVPEELETCYEIGARWRFAASASGAAYDDLVLTFSGQDDSKKNARRKGKPGPLLPADLSSHNGSARYAYDGQHYVLVEGRNPAREY